MSNKPKPNIAAIIVAAGSGQRFRQNGEQGSEQASSQYSKQYIEFLGRPVYQWSLEQFLKCSDIAQVVMVVAENMQDYMAKACKKFAPEKSIYVVCGGKTRQDSVRNGLKFLAGLPAQPEYVLVHDAARPLVNQAIISDVIAACMEYGACTTANIATDTVKLINGKEIVRTLDRQEVAFVQTPQAARFDWLLKAHQEAVDFDRLVTDDCQILELAGYKVMIVESPAFNIKLTRYEDLPILEALARHCGH